MLNIIGILLRQTTINLSSNVILNSKCFIWCFWEVLHHFLKPYIWKLVAKYVINLNLVRVTFWRKKTAFSLSLSVKTNLLLSLWNGKISSPFLSSPTSFSARLRLLKINFPFLSQIFFFAFFFVNFYLVNVFGGMFTAYQHPSTIIFLLFSLFSNSVV